MSNSLQPHGLQHTRLPYPSPAPRACSDSCPPSCWCHPTISSSVIPFSSCLQSFPPSVSFPVSQFFTSGGQSIGVSALASVLPMKIQDWFPLGLTGWISLKSKGLSRFFSNTMIQKHQFTFLFLYFYENKKFALSCCPSFMSQDNFSWPIRLCYSYLLGWNLCINYADEIYELLTIVFIQNVLESFLFDICLYHCRAYRICLLLNWKT